MSVKIFSVSSLGMNPASGGNPPSDMRVSIMIVGIIGR